MSSGEHHEPLMPYVLARQVTDEVMGEGAYARMNAGNPDPAVQAVIRMESGQTEFHVDPAVAVAVIRRLDAGWELYDRDSRWAWYKETKPGFDDETPTTAEVTLILRSRFGHEPEPYDP